MLLYELQYIRVCASIGSIGATAVQLITELYMTYMMYMMYSSIPQDGEMDDEPTVPL